jgi:hypothetical protein
MRALLADHARVVAIAHFWKVLAEPSPGLSLCHSSYAIAVSRHDIGVRGCCRCHTSPTAILVLEPIAEGR